ncbi:hypothetical protein Pla175_26730 [Pirellulimonas nuda]|uniref:Nickel uptake substrate-specific transmembrane region n=1 Tax=Pirellulimonas nuda TaxID=2528009 RepID=A0A518DCS2_9BACT|nr:carboxypeptidase regulatory-like domain-containing protein [Pirellulimonas nuda]QDU89284.1 hypothetical protein Pla175_26730 [Pirellulimonas nuda]
MSGLNPPAARISGRGGRWRPAQAALCHGVLLLLLTGGCGAPQTGPNTHPVTGSVIYQGKPAAAVTLTFSPKGEGFTTQAVTDRAGRFTVATYYDMGKKSKPGMVAGAYLVTAIKLDTASITSTMSAPKDLLPRKYGTTETSGLTAEVILGKENVVNLNLE